MSDYDKSQLAFWAVLGLVIFGIGLLVSTGIYYGTSYSYRWNRSCIDNGGMKMENTSGTVVCVRGQADGRVDIIPIAVKPFGGV